MPLKSAIVAAICLMTQALTAQAPEGIPREFARQRAQRLWDVSYSLRFSLSPEASSAPGHEELKFRLRTPGPLLLDFRDGTVSNMKINGKEAPATITNGHIALAGDLLQAQNTVTLDFTAPIATAGKALTRFEDKDDGSEYIYTLFVPMDADMAFPCFDQPDIKAEFGLSVEVPEEWTVISNSRRWDIGEIDDRSHRINWSFPPTKPISTYLFAFAAGPFRKVHDLPGLPGLYVRRSKVQQAEKEAAAVQQVTADGIKYLSNYFAQPFPFPKYDLVLIPGFAYGGMEHAGATFLREESILFRTVPTHSDLLGRDLLLLHETTHQWFGDLVTMRWFDDLWLKEGFAQYMAYHALADLKPNENIWKRFYQAIKPAAYGIDSTPGTTPIYQDIANLKDAKSAYGAIVYSKAPGVLKQLAFVLGENDFREGLRLYLKQHAYNNAEWADLVGAFEKVSGKPLGGWADAYLKKRGMPQVDVARFECDDANHLRSLVLAQHDVLSEGGVWPITTQMAVWYANSASFLTLQFDTSTADITQKVQQNGCPDFVFANYNDHAYGRFLLDARSRKAVMARLGGLNNVFDRALLWGSLWDSVREADLDPREYIELALRLLPGEKDESMAQSILGRMSTALHRYVSADVRAQLARRAEDMAWEQMLYAESQDMRISWFRALRGVAETPVGRGYLKDLLRGNRVIPGVPLRPLDRWNVVTALVALNDSEADTVLKAEQERDASGDGLKYAYTASAARPDAGVKKQYFHDYLHDSSRPEDWVEQSLGAFNYWNQTSLTLPYLQPALEALPQMKRERKIFFVLGWLNAFIESQQSPEAQAKVREFLRTAALDPDLRLKVLEAADELDRTVRIREKYGAAKAADFPASAR